MAHTIPSGDLPPIERLRAIMHILRAPGGCPWDAEQTHESLARHAIEEAYEVADAVRAGDRDAIVDELGDLLLQPVFHAEIASETGEFDLDDVAAAIGEKLIRRHPHVFGEESVPDSDSVLSQWEAIKASERGESGEAARPSAVGKANDGIPSLMAAHKVQKKAARVGFDWPEAGPVLEKIREELDETAAALAANDPVSIEEEIGDLLFAVANLARKCGLESELMLHRANRKFVDRFAEMERLLESEGTTIDRADLETMDRAWEKVKSGARPKGEKTG